MNHEPPTPVGFLLGMVKAAAKRTDARTFAAHAIAIMFIAGLWKGAEKEFMDLAAKRLLIVQFDVARLLKGLFTLFNVRVFAN